MFFYENFNTCDIFGGFTKCLLQKKGNFSSLIRKFGRNNNIDFYIISLIMIYS